MWRPWTGCAVGGPSLTLNCGYGRGYTVKEVIEAVKRVSGVDFPVTFSARRPGDPPSLVASAERIRSELDWTPELDDLPSIVRHALDWEASLARRKALERVASA